MAAVNVERVLSTVARRHQPDAQSESAHSRYPRTGSRDAHTRSRGAFIDHGIDHHRPFPASPQVRATTTTRRRAPTMSIDHASTISRFRRSTIVHLIDHPSTTPCAPAHALTCKGWEHWDRRTSYPQPASRPSPRLTSVIDDADRSLRHQLTTPVRSSGRRRQNPGRSRQRIDRSRNVIGVETEVRAPLEQRASEERRAAGVAAYRELGLAGAHEATGEPKSNLRRWAREAGFDPSELSGADTGRTTAATAARLARCEAMRSDLQEQLLETAANLLERIEEPHIDFRGKESTQVEFPKAPAAACRDYVVATAVLIDKYRLEVGEVTGRNELVGLERTPEAEQELAKIIDIALQRRAS